MFTDTNVPFSIPPRARHLTDADRRGADAAAEQTMRVELRANFYSAAQIDATVRRERQRRGKGRAFQ